VKSELNGSSSAVVARVSESFCEACENGAQNRVGMVGCVSLFLLIVGKVVYIYRGDGEGLLILMGEQRLAIAVRSVREIHVVRSARVHSDGPVAVQFRSRRSAKARTRKCVK
jgi:hypothetical protein